MIDNNFDTQKFEEDWRLLCIEVCQAVYTNPEIQTIKNSLQTNSFLSLEEKSKFIDICNHTKYAIIENKFGGENSSGYEDFSNNWKVWFQSKGVESGKSKGQRDSVEHLMFGSTPDPVRFLLNFEKEVLGSLKPNQ